MSGFLVQAAEADVQVVVVPEVQKLGTSVGKVGMADVNRRDKGTVPFVQLAIERDGFWRFGDQAKHGLVLAVEIGGGKDECGEQQRGGKGMFHGSCSL